MHRHQRKGFKFIWEKIAGGTHLSELLKRNCSDSGDGCIISHAPGTGKTRLTIAFLQTYMKLYPASRPLIIAPRSMLLSWEAELQRWKAGIPFHNVNMPDMSGNENALAVNLLGRANHHVSNIRLVKLYSWKKDGGILGLSYKLYEFLTVLDEGHTPRNERSLIWKALCKWQSLINPIGKFEEGKVGDNKLKELRSMLDEFVHIYKGNILQTDLPGLRDSVIVLRPQKFQNRILEGVYDLKSSLKRNYVASLVSVHPSLLPECERKHFPRDKDEFERFRLSPERGVKTKFLMELIRLCEAKKEKVLVFSEFIHPLRFIMNQLKSHFGWMEGNQILYMDGQIDVRQKQSSINTFNDSSSDARVLLASKKACSEGINLVGASRVVLLDVVWNPSVERQAISRAYRLGQKKVVHVYQLISGTMEWDKYFLQAKKSWLSELVFSTTQQADSISNAISDDTILEEMVNNLKDMFEKIIHQPKESSLIETFGLVDQEATF
uniref:Helicase C-terminal domain-containing protein n=1 Tax=Kalanchoe fedtschenkoi TaxID=63787 RepID=A0A7N0UW43_KALFE